MGKTESERYPLKLGCVKTFCLVAQLALKVESMSRVSAPKYLRVQCLLDLQASIPPRNRGQATRVLMS